MTGVSNIIGINLRSYLTIIHFAYFQDTGALYKNTSKTFATEFKLFI